MPAVLNRTARTTSPSAPTTPIPRTAASVLGIALAALATVVWPGSFVTSRALHDSGRGRLGGNGN